MHYYMSTMKFRHKIIKIFIKVLRCSNHKHSPIRRASRWKQNSKQTTRSENDKIQALYNLTVPPDGLHYQGKVEFSSVNRSGDNS